MHRFLLLLLLVIVSCTNNTKQRPDTFVEISEVIPDAIYDIRYFTEYNFVGTVIDGYLAPKCYLTKQAANALQAVQNQLKPMGYAIKIFDCYRPQTAVNHFIRWGEDLNDELMKDIFYPDVDKKDLFKLGFIAAKSSHSRGSTLDLTIVDSQNNQVDMGSPFDFFGTISHTDYADITATQKNNRQLLKTAMEGNGFVNLPEEWWHYTLKDEPYPDTYFDFPVE